MTPTINPTVQVNHAKNFKDITGQRFGRLVVVGLAGRTGANNRIAWLCRCDCGKTSTSPSNRLKAGQKKSCGCLSRDSQIKHGHATDNMPSPENRAYHSMIGRCYRESNDSYLRYGGRGIVVCEHWLSSFENFLDDVGCRPSKQHSLGRINGDKNYEPGNVRWETQYEQNNNKRNNVFYDYQGERLTLPALARKFKLNENTLCGRVRQLHWPIAKAIETPIKVLRKSNAVPA